MNLFMVWPPWVELDNLHPETERGMGYYIVWHKNTAGISQNISGMQIHFHSREWMWKRQAANPIFPMSADRLLPSTVARRLPDALGFGSCSLPCEATTGTVSLSAIFVNFS